MQLRDWLLGVDRWSLEDPGAGRDPTALAGQDSLRAG